MLKKFLIGIGAFASLIIIGIIGIGIYTGYKSAEYDETAVPYIKAAIPEISKWDKDIFYSYLSSEAKEEINEDDLAKIIRLFSKMGSLISFEEPEFTKSHSYVAVGGNPRTIIVYNVDAKYENGEALLKFTLVGENDVLKLHHFNLSSMALIE